MFDLRKIRRIFRKTKWLVFSLFGIYNKKIKLGEENSDKTFYLIKFTNTNVGLFSYFITALGYVKYAKQKNYIPIVDMKTYENTYLEKKKVDIENSWEYFFNPLNSFEIKEVYESKNVILSPKYPYEWPDDSSLFFNNKKNILKWRKFAKESITINKQITKAAHKKYLEFFNESDRVLGLKCRGTDYLKLKPKSHPVQPDVDMCITKVKEVMKQHKCNKILLATEDQEVFDIFKSEFKELVFSTDDIRPQYSGVGYISEASNNRIDDKFLSGVEYLRTILMLTMCDCFISGRNSGAVGVLLLADGFDYEYIFDLGVYK